MVEFEHYARAGGDYIGENDDYRTYHIDVKENSGQWWHEQIDVYGSKELRDLIVVLLNEYYHECNP